MANWLKKLFGGSSDEKQHEEENKIEEKTEIKMEAPVMNEAYPEENNQEERKEDVVVEETTFTEEKKEGDYNQNQESQETEEGVR